MGAGKLTDAFDESILNHRDLHPSNKLGVWLLINCFSPTRLSSASLTIWCSLILLVNHVYSLYPFIGYIQFPVVRPTYDRHVPFSHCSITPLNNVSVRQFSRNCPDLTAVSHDYYGSGCLLNFVMWTYHSTLQNFIRGKICPFLGQQSSHHHKAVS